MNDKLLTFPFIQNGIELKPGKQAPVAGMTLRAAGTMRFRWNETNPTRQLLLQKIRGSREIVPVELIHSHIVYDVHNASDTHNLQGDGIITRNRNLLPVVTVADCMPVFVYDTKQKRCV